MEIRIDRLATLYVADPLRRCTFTGKWSIPILMYHGIANEDEAGVRPYYRTITSPAVFTQHIEHLHDLGYTVISLRDAVKILRGQRSTQKHAVVTFDDGYADFYTNAFPAIARHGFTATVFLPTGYIGKVARQFKGKDCLTWGAVRELHKYGISFGSHTVSHPQLSSLDQNAIKHEILNSKHTIEDNLGECVDAFAYPYAFPEQNGSFVRMLKETLEDAGYHHGVSTRIGTARPHEDRYFLRRVPVNSLDDRLLFEAKLRGGYDWLSKLQYASKFIRAKVVQ